MARLANFEDVCKSRFWESRFNSKALLDDAAWLAATAYVDLNPVRAKIVKEPTESPHTSIRRRMQTRAADVQDLLPMFSGIDRPLHQKISLDAYCSLPRNTATGAITSSPSFASHALPNGIDGDH